MNLRRVVPVGMSLFMGLVLAGPAFATQPGRCTQITEVSSTDGGAGHQILATAPARLCSARRARRLVSTSRL